MSVPTPTAEVYVSCVGMPLSIGGSATVPVAAGGFKITSGSDDMTNNQDAGWESDAKTTRGAELNFKVSWKSALGLVVGDVYPLLVNVAAMPTDFTLALTPTDTGKPAYAGQVRILTADAPVWNAKNGVSISFTAKSQGPTAYLF